MRATDLAPHVRQLWSGVARPEVHGAFAHAALQLAAALHPLQGARRGCVGLGAGACCLVPAECQLPAGAAELPLTMMPPQACRITTWRRRRTAGLSSSTILPTSCGGELAQRGCLPASLRRSARRARRRRHARGSACLAARRPTGPAPVPGARPLGTPGFLTPSPCYPPLLQPPAARADRVAGGRPCCHGDPGPPDPEPPGHADAAGAAPPASRPGLQHDCQCRGSGCR